MRLSTSTTFVATLIAGTICVLPAMGREWYVAPRGKPDAPGTQRAPRDLLSVLAGAESVKPGDTVWLMPGDYLAPEKDGKRQAFVSELTGTSDQPIVLRAMPGERVRLDGWLEVKGSHTWYWGFEVADSTYTNKTKEGVAGHGTSITVFGPGTRFINLDVHDGAMGFGCWSPAVDCEIYGCLIHDFGYDAADRGHGHAIYTQNERGTKRIVDNIMFRGFGWNVHVYGQQGQLRGYHVEGNICFSAGTRVRGQVTDNILVSGYLPADNITLVDNYCYHPGGEPDRGARWRPCVRVDCYRDAVNGTCLVRGNVIMGARGLQVGRWKRATITGNKIWGPEVVASVRPPEGTQYGNYKWDANTNVLNDQEAPFIDAGQKGTAERHPGAGFARWKEQTGFDRNSEIVEGSGGKPTGTWVYVRPNKYEPGRGHVAVFNWDGQTHVEADLSKVLKSGARYVVHNVQDLYGQPAASGRYDGKPVKLSMIRSAIAPDFDAFLVRGEP